MPNDPIETLTEDHQGAKVKLDLLEQAANQTAGGPAARAREALPRLREVLAFLDGELRGHFRCEEEALFPVLERHIGREGGPIAVMLAEHEQLWGLVDDLRSHTQGLEAGEATAGPRAAQTARAIVGLLRNHIVKEDDVLFPLAREAIGPEGVSEVAHRCEVLGLR